MSVVLFCFIFFYLKNEIAHGKTNLRMQESDEKMNSAQQLHHPIFVPYGVAQLRMGMTRHHQHLELECNSTQFQNDPKTFNCSTTMMSKLCRFLSTA